MYTPPIRCSACPNLRQPIPGNGPLPCRIMFIGEGPARDEDRTGLPFQGRTGKELNQQYLLMAGLDRSDCYVTNISKCSMPGYRNPKLETCVTCSDRFLEWELHRCKPEIVVVMGALACTTLGISLLRDHATPIPFRYKSFEGVAFPMYHPAAGLRPGDIMVKLQYGFRRLRDYLSGSLLIPEDEYPNPNYRRIDSGSELSSYWDPCAITAIDTESPPKSRRVFCLSTSQRPGTGIVIYPATNAYQSLQSFLSRGTNPVVMHNSPHDTQSLLEEGFRLPIIYHPHRFYDTMVEASHTQYLPQGLKYLAKHLCGIKMQAFQDLVTPYSLEILQEWLAQVFELLHGMLYTTQMKRKRDPVTRKLVPRMVETADREHPPEWFRLRTKVNRLLGDIQKMQVSGFDTLDLMDDADSLDGQDSPHGLDVEDTGTSADSDEGDGVLDPWKRISMWHQHDHELLGALVTPLPLRNIADVPMEKTIQYSARDADATLRVLHAIRGLPRDRVI